MGLEGSLRFDHFAYILIRLAISLTGSLESKEAVTGETFRIMRLPW